MGDGENGAEAFEIYVVFANVVMNGHDEFAERSSHPHKGEG